MKSFLIDSNLSFSFSKIEKILRFTSLISFLTLIGLSFFYYEIPLSFSLIFLISSLLSFFIYITKQRLFLYTLGRILEAFLTIFIVASITFLLLRLLPGGPFDQEKALAPEIKANIEAKYHLDKPLYWQYTHYMKGLLRGYLGESYKYTDRNISDILKDSLPISIQLGVYALILAFLIGVPIGVFSAQRQNTLSDRTAMILSISGVSLPSFVIAPLFILFFSFYLGWLEPALWEGTLFYILPAVVLGLRPASVIARLTRSSVLDAASADYVRTGRAKGLDETTLFYKHILKNAFLPVLTFSAPLTAGILTGSFIIEKIFAIPGLGQHFINSVTNRDYPLILGALLVYSFLLILSNLIVDLLYTYFDPRIKLS